MTIKKIDRIKCEACVLRTTSGCPVKDSCATDVLRLDEKGFPVIVYPCDCQSCFWCQMDCPEGAIEVSAAVPMPFLTKTKRSSGTAK